MCGWTENAARVTVPLGGGTVERRGLVGTIVKIRDVHFREPPQLGGMPARKAQSRPAKELQPGPSTRWPCRVCAVNPCSSFRRLQPELRDLFDAHGSSRCVQHLPILDYHRICATRLGTRSRHAG